MPSAADLSGDQCLLPADVPAWLYELDSYLQRALDVRTADRCWSGGVAICGGAGALLICPQSAVATGQPRLGGTFGK